MHPITTKILVILLLGVTLMLIGRFIYYNIIIPEPYREELKTCLVKARTLETKEKTEAAENICFRTYPHFN